MSDRQPAPLLTRALVAEQIRAHLAGRLSAAALAGWAFDRFYAVETEAERYEAGAEAPLAAALDALMFADEVDFQLDEEELRSMLAQLERP